MGFPLQMELAPLGVLKRRVDDEYASAPVEIPLLGGKRLELMFKGVFEDEKQEDFSDAVTHFLALPESALLEATDSLYESYQFMAGEFEDEEWEEELGIKKPEDVWDHVEFSTIVFSRRVHGDREVYVQVMGNCDWEDEHGLQLVFRRGHTLSRVSEIDGHLVE